MQVRDTIAAIATGAGSGGLGVIRISGVDALLLLKKLFQPSSTAFQEFRPRVLHHGAVMLNGMALDDVLAVFFPSPHSYTGEDVAEIHAHGGPALLNGILDACLAEGARLAEHGEFTKRAFLNGRMELSQAEAVAEIIAAPGLEGARLAAAKLQGLLGKRISELRDKIEYLRRRLCLSIDFPEEEGECLPHGEFHTLLAELMDATQTLLASYQRARTWRDGALVVLAGQVNAGKSSLMNALLGRPRAIVTDRAGTTRDYLEESTSLGGVPVRLTDTAGLRPWLKFSAASTDQYSAGQSDLDHDSAAFDAADLDPIEAEGIRRSHELMAQADLILLVIDGRELAAGTQTVSGATAAVARQKKLLPPRPILLIWNKNDAAPLTPEMQAALVQTADCPVIPVSAKSGEGLEVLAAQVRRMLVSEEWKQGDVAPNYRQAGLLQKALAELQALDAELELIPSDIAAVRLESASSYFAEITGLSTTDETFNAIFADFCIGK